MQIYLVTKFIRTIAVCAGLFLVAGPLFAQDVLRVGVTSFPTSRGNPFNTTTGTPSIYTYAAFIEGLTRVNNAAEPVPMLAERWEIESRTSWLFHMRPGAVFSNGEPADAHAVEATYAMLRTGIGLTYPITRELEGIVAIEALDNTTVRIVTEAPDILIPNKVASFKVVPPRYWAEVGPDGFAGAPIGSGPYQVETWGSAQIDLVRSPTAWRQPKISRLELVAGAEAVARVQGVLAGNLHIGLQLGPDEIIPVEAAGHQMIIGMDPSMQVLALITVKESPLQDVRVRQALNYAVNRQVIAQGLLGGHITMATQTAPRIAFGYAPDLDIWPYDPDKAKALLAEAGYPDGFSFTAEILLQSASYSPQVYQQVAADLARVGVDLTIRRIPASQYARGVYQGEWAGEAVGIDYGVNPTLDSLTPLVRHSCLWIKPWFCEPSILPLIERAQAAFDLEERRRLTQEVMRAQRAFAPAILLYETGRFDAVTRNVRGYSIEVGHIDYDKIYFAENDAL
jgi:peptide/nickel transport system substrate-binding protein